MAKQSSDKTQHDEQPKEKADPREERKENIIAIIIVIVVCGAITWFIYSSLHPQQSAAADDQRYPIPIGLSPTIGNESAKVVVVEFSDFECPFCGEFARSTYPAVKKQYIDTGKILFVFKNYPLSIHPYAQRAAQAGVCAQLQKKFWDYHDMLYTHQDNLQIGDLTDYAQTLGLNADQFSACMTTEIGAPQVQEDSVLGGKLGVTGTPTFFFNGRKVVGLLSPDEFSAEVEKELK